MADSGSSALRITPHPANTGATEAQSLNPATQELKLDSVRHQVPWKDQTPQFRSAVGLKAKLHGAETFHPPADNYLDMEYLTKVFPYAVLYTVENDYIFIVTVMHCHREPRYWQKRAISDHPG